MESLSYTISMVLLGLIVAETIVGVRARRAIRGSRERYVALTQRRILSWVVNIGFGVQGIVGLALGQQSSLISLLFSAYLIYVEVKNHHDDDDWFKGRAKKIGRAIGRAVTRALTPPVKSPSPVRSPSPVFG